AAPPTAAALYLSFHSSLLVLASRHSVTSSAPWRAKTYSLLPTRTGEDSPTPTVIFHFCVSALGQAFGSRNSVTLLSRLGPRHCGQSWAQVAWTPHSKTQPSTTPVVRFAVLMVAPLWIPAPTPSAEVRSLVVKPR